MPVAVWQEQRMQAEDTVNSLPHFTSPIEVEGGGGSRHTHGSSLHAKNSVQGVIPIPMVYAGSESIRK